MLTHATGALSFLALRFSDSDMIRAFGLAGVISMVIALVTVLIVLPALGLLIAPTGARVASLSPVDTGVNALRAFCDWIADRMTRRPRLASVGALVVVIVLGVAYFGLEPRYRLADQAPDREHAIDAINRIDAKLAGANPVDVMITFPPGRTSTRPRRSTCSPGAGGRRDAGRRRQRVVAADTARLAEGKARQDRRRDDEVLRRHPAELPDAPLPRPTAARN